MWVNMETSKATSVFLVLVISMSVIVAFGAKIVCASSPSLQICIILDGSSSISATEWDGIRDAVADAIVQAIPRNSTIELSVVQFGYDSKDGYAKTEVMPTVISNNNYASVANHVRTISRGASGTSTAHGLFLAWQVIKNSIYFQDASRQVVNLVTDGLPSVRNHNSTSDLDGSGANDVKDDFIAVMNSAVGEGLDELDVEGIGMPNATRDWWQNWGIQPQPGLIAPPFTKPGWIRLLRNVTEFADTIEEDFQSTLTEFSQPTSWLVYVVAVSIVATIMVVLIVFMTKRKRTKPGQAMQHNYPPPPPPAQAMATDSISRKSAL
jgi:hypothetical protein